MSHDALLIVLGAAAATLAAVAVLRRAGIPAPVVLVVAGLIIGFLPFVPDVALQPDVVLLGLLPLLVYDAAATASPTAFVRNARPIGLLAVVLVVATAAGVAAVAHQLGHLSWPMAFVLGTAVGPTDASAVIGIVRRLGLPRRLLTVLEGEALFNDVTALVLYTAAVAAATTGHFSVLHTTGAVGYSTMAGGAIGLGVGLVGRALLRRVDDAPVEIAGSILLAYAAYLPAEVLSASGVLAAVLAGLCLGWHSDRGTRSARTRLQSAAFWETLVFLVDAILFALVGLSLHTFSKDARGPLGRLALTATVVVATVVGMRLLWMWAAGRLARPGAPRQDTADKQAWRERLVLGWSGMRGAITLAAILAVPKTTDAGQPLAGRADIVYLGFAVIIVTLVAQGLTLPALVRRLRLSEHPLVVDSERQARLELTRAALGHLEETAVTDELAEEVVDGLRAQYIGRLHRLEATDDDEGLAEQIAATAEAELAAHRDLNAFQRRTLSDLLAQRRIGVTTLRTIERDLDLEEVRLSSV